MMYRMMGGCLAAAWDGPHRAAYASPATGGPSHVQAFAWGRCRNPTAPAGAAQSVSRRSPPSGGDWGRRASGFRRRPLTTTKRRTTRHEPRRFHRQVQGRHSAKGGGVLPAALPALGKRRDAPQAAPQAPGSAGRRHQGRALSLKAHRGTTVVGEMGTGKTFSAPRYAA